MTEAGPGVSAFIAEMPKAELHVHLEGTVEGEMVLAIGARNGLDLPYKTAEEVRALQNQSKTNLHNNLENFLRCLDLSRGVLRTAQDWRDVADAWFERCAQERIVYTETMVDPQQAIRQGLEMEACLEALIDASEAARVEHGVHARWIVNFQRDHPPEEALALMPRLAPYRDAVVGIGLDNFETPGFPQLFAEVFDVARRMGFHVATHCDVNQPDSLRHIRDSLDLLQVSRIDHGLNVADDPELVEQVLEREVALTACPTFYTSMVAPPPDRLEKTLRLARAGVLISLNSDDPAQFGSGYLTTVLAAFQKISGVDDTTLVDFMKNSFRSSWLEQQSREGFLSMLDDFQAEHRLIPSR